MKRHNKKLLQMISIFLIFSFIISLSRNVSSSSYSKQDFIVNNDTEIILDEDSTIYYNGTITVTVTEGIGVNATVNGQTQEILLDESKEFIIQNTKEIYFTITSVGLSRGYFEIFLNIDLDAGDSNPITITVGILAAFLIILSVTSYYIRSKRLETKPDEDEDTIDPEVIRRRKEAAGAEKRFWGLDEKK